MGPKSFISVNLNINGLFLEGIDEICSNVLGKKCINYILLCVLKMKYFSYLGGLVENQLFSRDGLMEYAKLPSIEVARGELVSILNLAAGGKTRSLLESHQQTLCRNLEQYVKQNMEGSSEES